MKITDIPESVRDAFTRFFEEYYHDEEDEDDEFLPATERYDCDERGTGIDGCFEKIGSLRMAQVWEDFVNQSHELKLMACSDGRYDE